MQVQAAPVMVVATVMMVAPMMVVAPMMMAMPDFNDVVGLSRLVQQCQTRCSGDWGCLRANGAHTNSHARCQNGQGKKSRDTFHQGWFS
jgi:hypothetical protein